MDVFVFDLLPYGEHLDTPFYTVNYDFRLSPAVTR